MVLKDDQQKVKALLTEAITVLCKNGLQYRAEFSVEGLLGITLDNDEVFLININETIRADFASTPPKAMPPMMPRVTPMSAPAKPMGRGRGVTPAGRGRPPTAVNRKRSLEQDFNKQSSTPGTPTHPSPHSSSVGSPPGTPGTPQQQTGLQDSDQPPAKRLHEAQDGDDVGIEDGQPRIKSEPDGMHEPGGDWDQQTDQQTDQMAMPSFGDELNLQQAGMDQMNTANVKMENVGNVGQGLQAGAGPGMLDALNGELVSGYFLKDDAYNCTRCEKTFRTKQGLSRHMEHHTGNYKWWCEDCKKGFIGHTSYKNHMMRHAGTCFFCAKCGLVFHTQQSYNKHLQKQHGSSD